jgi:hypothetical protein
MPPGDLYAYAPLKEMANLIILTENFTNFAKDASWVSGGALGSPEWCSLALGRVPRALYHEALCQTLSSLVTSCAMLPGVARLMGVTSPRSGQPSTFSCGWFLHGMLCK